MFTNENKFQLFEVVTVAKDRPGFTAGQIGFITEMRQFSWNGLWEYQVFMYDDDARSSLMEDEIKSSGEFLPQEKIEERLKIISNKNQFAFYEIVEVLHSEEPELIGQKGYIRGMAQNYNTGEWGYSIVLFSNGDYVGGFEEPDLQATGEHLSKAEISKRYDGSSLKVTTGGEVTEVNIKNPQNWEERVATPDRTMGWKEDNAS
jgi:hypothetical protein